jgi:hypothetical protein
MTFRDLPSHVERALAAARRLHPAHGLFVTVTPESSGPGWEYHPVRRHLILRTAAPGQVLEGVACSLLARNHCLGRKAVTAVPEHLRPRHVQALRALRAALRGRAATPGGAA